MTFKQNADAPLLGIGVLFEGTELDWVEVYAPLRHMLV